MALLSLAEFAERDRQRNWIVNSDAVRVGIYALRGVETTEAPSAAEKAGEFRGSVPSNAANGSGRRLTQR